jgi:8-oxo-dGTP diphosphatase
VARAVIEAAGGVVWRESSKSWIKVLLVHRPAYDDWSLPKGKTHRRETHRQAAIREVREETGLLCKARQELRCVRYLDRKGRLKRVRYWVMEPLSGQFKPNDEVDEVRWVPAHNVDATVTCRRDAGVVAEFLELITIAAGTATLA